jgi:hypothetical protein
MELEGIFEGLKFEVVEGYLCCVVEILYAVFWTIDTTLDYSLLLHVVTSNNSQGNLMTKAISTIVSLQKVPSSTPNNRIK